MRIQQQGQVFNGSGCKGDSQRRMYARVFPAQAKCPQQRKRSLVVQAMKAMEITIVSYGMSNAAG